MPVVQFLENRLSSLGRNHHTGAPENASILKTEFVLSLLVWGESLIVTIVPPRGQHESDFEQGRVPRGP